MERKRGNARSLIANLMKMEMKFSFVDRLATEPALQGAFPDIANQALVQFLLDDLALEEAPSFASSQCAGIAPMHAALLPRGSRVGIFQPYK